MFLRGATAHDGACMLRRTSEPATGEHGEELLLPEVRQQYSFNSELSSLLAFGCGRKQKMSNFRGVPRKFTLGKAREIIFSAPLPVHC